jgi:hypothetical protein
MSAGQPRRPPLGDTRENTEEYDMNENTTPEQVQASEAVAEQSYQNAVDAGARIAELETQVARLNQGLADVTSNRDAWFDKYTNARKYIQDSITREDWSESELAEPFWTELAELMDLEINREVNVVVTVTFTGTMTLPIGTDPEDLGSYDWSAELAHDCYSSDFSVDDMRIRES